MTNQLSSLAQEVVAGYERLNCVDDPEVLDDVTKKCSVFNSSVKEIGVEEGISPTAVKKCIRKAKDRMAMRLYIITEVERLERLFNGSVSSEEIDELVSDSLSNLIKSGEFGTHLQETVL